MQPSLPWFTSRPYLDTLGRLEAIAAVPMKRRLPIWYHRPPVGRK